MERNYTLAIIPARGGSTRLKRKNVYNLCGKPLLAYTVEAAQLWGGFHHIYVNTDDEHIIDCAQKLNVEVYKRPEKLSDNKTKVIDVVKEQIISMHIPSKTILGILLPTCPLRSQDDLNNAFVLFEKYDMKYPVVSVTEYEKAPEQALIIGDGGLLKPKFSDSYSSRSQDHSVSYRYNTAIIFSRADIFLSQKDIVGLNSIPYIMPFNRSIDIDYLYHIELIEAILKSGCKINTVLH